MAAAADGSLSRAVIQAAVDAVAPGGQALRQLALAMAADPGALASGAPPVVGRLAAELIACGSAVLTLPSCTVCGRTGKPLFRGDAAAAVCQRCRSLAARRRVRQLREDPSPRRPRRGRAAGLRGLPAQA